MKMNSAQIEQTLHKLNTEEELNAEAIPAGHPMMSQLERLFGEHTYFLDSNGLDIVEPLETEDGRLGVVVNLAHWVDDRAESLQPHEPKPTELVIDLRAGRRH